MADTKYGSAQLGLGELYLKDGNEAGLSRQVAALEGLGDEGAAGAAILEGAVRKHPDSVGVRVALSYVWLSDGSPPEVIEAARRSVLEIDPDNAQARHNMEVLLRNTGRWVEAVIDSL